MTYTAEMVTIKGLCTHIQTGTSHFLKKRFGKLLKTQTDINVYSAFDTVFPTGNPETQYIPKEAAFLVATMFYKYRNKHDTPTELMPFEEALRRGYSVCGSESGKRDYERLLAMTPGTQAFSHTMASICNRLQKVCDLSAINYVALLHDVTYWNKDRGIARRWSRTMHRFAVPVDMDEFDNN